MRCRVAGCRNAERYRGICQSHYNRRQLPEVAAAMLPAKLPRPIIFDPERVARNQLRSRATSSGSSTSTNAEGNRAGDRGRRDARG